MKKLSFIMAVIMIVMSFSVMFVTSASAAVTLPADAYVPTQDDIDSGKLCKTGDEYFDSIPDALAAAEDGAVIYVFKDKDYGTLASPENWSLYGKNLTIDFLGHTLKGTQANRLINLNYEGTTYVDADKGSELIVKNAKIECTGTASIYQIYNYMTATFDNCEITLENTGNFGIAISQYHTTLKLINGCNVTVKSRGASTYSNNTNGVLFRDNGSQGNTFIVEDSYVYTPGILMKSMNTGAGFGPVTFKFKNSTIETGHQNMFVLQTHDATIDIDNCNLNVYKDGRYSDEKDTGALIWQHAATDRTKVSIKNSNINVNDMLSSQYVIAVDDGSKNTLGSEYTIENTNITANGGSIFKVGGDVDFTVDGGSYIADGRIITATHIEAVNQARVAIYGGQFVARNHTKNISDFSGTTPQSGAIMASNGVSFDIYGGTFALYQDSNSILNSTAPIIFSWAGASELIKVYGGTFIGGCGMMARVTYSGDEKAPYAAENAKIYAYEEGKTSVVIAPEVVKGASVRLDTKSGLRFTSNINAWTVNYVATELAKEGTDVVYGTIITRASYLKYTAGVFTKEAFDKMGMSNKYLDVVAKDGIVKNTDGSITINAALVDIDAANYDKDFVAISYIKYTNADDEEAYIYAGNVTLAENARNMEEVALAALADVQTKSTGAYTNAVSEYYVYNMMARKYELVTGTAYSAYTADQIKALQSYIVEDAE